MNLWAYSMKALASTLHLPKTLFICFLAALVLMAVSAVSFVQLPAGHSAELTAPEKALMFLEDVVEVDVAKYDVTLASNWVDYPPHWGGLAEEVVRHDLDGGNESSLRVTCRFREDTVHSYSLQASRGSPIFAEPQPTSLLDAAKGFIKRYQTYFKASYIKEMRSMLDMVDGTEDATVTSGNMKLTILNQEVQNDPTVEPVARTLFEWTYTVNDVDAPQNVVRVTFEEGVFKSLVDDWNLYSVGSSEVNVSREEAISLARKAAEDYKLQIYLEDGLTDVEFKLADEPVRAGLSMYPRETLTVYPFWRIELYFDKHYYSAYGIQVGIWADTGEIKSCESLSGLGGAIPEQEQTEPPTEQDQTAASTEQNDDAAASTNIYIITAAAATALVAAALLIHFRKARKTATKAEDNAGNTVTTEQMGQTYGYQVIPEFPSCIILPFLFAAALTAILYKRRLPKNPSNQQKPFIVGD
jgi:hypothetical protein